jgi:hypothetical protein
MVKQKSHLGICIQHNTNGMHQDATCVTVDLEVVAQRILIVPPKPFDPAVADFQTLFPHSCLPKFIRNPLFGTAPDTKSGLLLLVLVFVQRLITSPILPGHN